MKKLNKLFAILIAVLGINSTAKADTSILQESDGWQKITALPSNLGDYYYVFVDNSQDLMLTMATGANQGNTYKTMWYQKSGNPAKDLNRVWTLESNTTKGNVSIRNVAYDHLCLQTEWNAAWNFRTHDNGGTATGVNVSWTGFTLAYAAGKWSIQNGNYPDSGYLGPWNNNIVENAEVACNKTGNAVGYFQVYAISKADFNDFYVASNSTEGQEIKVDLSFNIGNPTIEGRGIFWTSTTGCGCNYTTNKQDGTTGGFLENWSGSGPVGKIYQTITGLPNGVYELKMKAFRNNNLSGGDAVYVFANSDQTQVTTDNATTYYTVRTTLTGSTLELGLRQDKAGSQWIGLDEVSLTYLGVDLSELTAVVQATYDELNGLSKEPIPTAFSDEMEELLNKYKTLPNTEDGLNNANNELKVFITDYSIVSNAYTTLQSFISTCEDVITYSEEFEDGAKTTFSTAVSTAKSDVEAKTTAEAINTIYNTLEDARLSYIQKAEPTNGALFDYTFMVINPKFDEGTTGWTHNTGAPNWGIATNQGGAITGKFFENWKWESYTGEIYQELTGLPSGKYVLTVAAFRDQLITDAADGDAVYVFANDAEILVNAATPAFYSVEVSISTGTLRFGVKSKVAKYRWMGLDNVSLSYKGFDIETAKSGITSLINQAEELATKPMDKDVRTVLNQTIDNAKEFLAIAYPKRKESNAMMENLNHAMDNANASIAEYNTIATYIAKANAINESIAADYKTQHDNGTISESLETVFQKLEVATYNYVMSNFTYDVELEANGWIPEGPVGSLSGQHYDGTSTSSYLEQSGAAWGSDAWEISYKYEKTLPAGKYVFKVAGRRASGTGNTMSLQVTDIDDPENPIELGSVSDFPEGDTGLGINKKGETSFDSNDEAGFANDGAGRGWQWRYVMFELGSETKVQVAVNAAATTQWQWMSFCGASLQMTEKTYLEANKGELDAPTARANELLNGPMGSSEKQALQAAVNMTYTTGEQLYAKVHALNDAIEKAEAWIVAYNNAKAPLVAALERFEADFNDAENGALAYMNKNIWADVIEKVQSAALAKDDFASHERLTTAENELTAALNAAQASIDAYAALKIEVNSGNIPVKAENVANHAEYFEEAKSGYNNATIETDRANELVIALQNYRVEDYNYVVENYVMSKELTDEWVGKTEKQSSEHWSGDAEIEYFDYSHWSGAGTYEATQSITLPAGEYVLMAAGRASSVEGTEAYIKVDDTKVNFAAKGSYGHGIATDGTATFASDASYARGGEGYGWEYRFVTFTLTEKKEVTLVAGMTIADSRDPLSWASVCTPVLLTPDPAAAQEALQNAIEVAENVRDNAYPLGEEVFKISTKSDAYKSLVAAIATAQNVLETAATVSALNAGITELNAAVGAYKSNYVLNAPANGQRYYIKVATEGHGKYGNAVLATLGDAGDNNPTGYGLNANNAVTPYLNQAFTFTQVEGNLYNICIERAEGIVYLTYGALNGSAAGWKNQQIQATTDAEKKGEFKIEATAKNGVLKIKNTIDNNYLDCQDGGAIYTDTGIEKEEFAFELASENTVSLKFSSVGWATLILPFNATLPEGVKALSCGEADGETLTLIEAESIKANTPYLMNGYEGTHVFTGYGMAEKDSYTDGLFVGTYEEYKTTANSNTYVLQKKGDEVAFYLVGESGQPTVGANRCYMVYEGAAGAPKFRLGRGNTTGIDNAEPTIDNEVVIYDLMGRKVTTMEKGGMYIVNGKKVVIK